MATSAPRNLGMNPQYQALYDEEQRKMRLAEILAKQAEGGPMQYLEQPKTMQAAKLPGMAAIAPIIQAALSGYMRDKAGTGMAAAQKSNADEVRSGKEHFSLMPDKQKAIASLLTSANPALQDFGVEQQAREDSRLKTVTELQGKADIPGAISTFLAGDPNKAQGVKFQQPEVRTTPGPDGKPIPYLTNFADGGRPQATSIGLPSNISLSADAKLQQAEGEDLIKANVKGLEAGKEKAQLAQASIANSSRVIEGLERGAMVGGGQSPLQTVREWGKTFFGIDIPETGVTAETRAALGQAVLDNARKLAPVTAEDVRRLEKMLGSIDTDPAALPALMAWQTAKSLKALQDYEAQSGKLAEDSKFGKQYDALGTGAGMPQVLRGPMQWKMQVLQELQREGGDPRPLLKTLDPQGFAEMERSGLPPTFDIQGGPIRSKKAIADALLQQQRTGRGLPPGVRRK